MTVACDDMNSIIQDDLDKGEEVYPGKVGDVLALPGREKVKLYWQLNPDRRVTKTVITWNGGSIEKAVPEGSGIKIDSIEISNNPSAGINLEEGVYVFSLYTLDKDGHRSIALETLPVSIYGDVYVNALSARGITSMVMQSGGALRVNWQDTPADMLYSVVTYLNHTDSSDGVLKSDTVLNNATYSNLTGLKRLKEFSVKSIYQVGLDTASATGSYYPPVVEKELLATNGFTELTHEKALSIKTFNFPLSLTSTLQDLYYFPDIQLLDLTEGTSVFPTTTYERTYTDATTGAVTAGPFTSTVGGGDWPYFASGYFADDSRAILRDLLAVGVIKKIKYKPYSYPGLDADFASYIESGVVELTEPDPNVTEFLIPDNLRVDYRVQDNTQGATVEFSPDGSIVPDEIAAQFSGELKNVYKVTVNSKNSTIAFSLPAGVQFGFVPYGHVKADFYIHTTNSDYTWMNQGIGQINNYKLLRINRLTELEAFPDHSPFNFYQSLWNTGTYPDADLGVMWKNFDWNLVTVPGEHIRVITIQMGNDDVLWGLPGGKTLTYYIANLRLTK
jgi:hypothetical protein